MDVMSEIDTVVTFRGMMWSWRLGEGVDWVDGMR